MLWPATRACLSISRRQVGRSTGLAPVRHSTQAATFTAAATITDGGQSAGSTSDGSKKRKKRFHDCVRITATGGRGGFGCNSWEMTGPRKLMASGGNGGGGGSVTVIATRSVQDFGFRKRVFKAESGTHGKSRLRHGKRGRDVKVMVPVGTVIHELLPDESLFNDGGDELEDFGVVESLQDGEGNRGLEQVDRSCDGNVEASEDDGDEQHDIDQQDYLEELVDQDDEGALKLRDSWEETTVDPGDAFDDEFEAFDGYESSNYNQRDDFFHLIPVNERQAVQIIDLDTEGASHTVARGGIGGRGNSGIPREEAYQRRQQRGTDDAVHHASGTAGATANLLLELKTIADVGLVGLPNAGKSTLLRAISRAKPQVASYPFTTLHPHIGMVEFDDGSRFTVADIPGLIEGAHENKGLGHSFLRHIERTKVLVYVVDASQGPAGCPRTVLESFRKLQHELECYQPGMTARPSLLVANKIDGISTAGGGEYGVLIAQEEQDAAAAPAEDEGVLGDAREAASLISASDYLQVLNEALSSKRGSLARAETEQDSVDLPLPPVLGISARDGINVAELVYHIRTQVLEAERRKAEAKAAAAAEASLLGADEGNRVRIGWRKQVIVPQQASP